MENKRLRQLIDSFIRAWVTLKPLMNPVLNDKKHREIVMDVMQQLAVVLPMTTVLKLAGMSYAAFNYRLNQLMYQCQESAIWLCKRRHPCQLTRHEVNVIKEMVADRRFICWPISSLAAYARREGRLFAATSTWRKYLRILGITRKRPQPPEKKVGLRATTPNEYWHVDTTFWTLENGVKRAIVFVSDNYSRAILGWSIGDHGAQNVITALRQAIQTVGRYHPKQLSTTLVTDGGGENHALTVEELLQETSSPAISKIIASRKVGFSNSPIEAINKIIKRYLRVHRPENENQLFLCIKHSVYDYTEIRPHGSLDDMIPMEVYRLQPPKQDLSKAFSAAKAQRIAYNSASGCKVCS